MRIPGFTAKASLYKADCGYRLAAVSDLINDRNTVVRAAVNRWTDGEGCWHFDGNSTGAFWWWSRQCVTAPESQRPDAAMVEQCCGGWWQFPWIRVCPTYHEKGCWLG